jgi:hypothetical protein
MHPVAMRAVHLALCRMLDDNDGGPFLSPEMERAARQERDRMIRLIEDHEARKAKWRAVAKQLCPPMR